MRKSFFLAAGLYILAACSSFEQNESQMDLPSAEDAIERVVFEVLPIKDFDAPETKAAAVPNASGSNVAFQWEVTDTVGIYPNTGAQIYFSMESGAGTSSADFNGGGWALKQNSTYVSYYPFVADYYLDPDAIPVSFSDQKQIGTTPPFLGARYYLASNATSSNNGVLRFTYSTLNTIINIKATLPAGTYTKASLTVDEPLFVEDGTYSLSNKTIVGTKFSKTLEIDLEDFTLAAEGQVPVYIMSAPVDLSGKEVTVKFFSSDGKRYKCVKNTIQVPFVAGNRYGLVCAMQECYDGNNVIYYTSTDGEIVTPFREDVFGANIISNEYDNGQGIIEFDSYVTTIGENAFRGRSKLTSITIPETVTTIGESAFYGCIGLTGDLVLHEGVTTIGDSVFSGCEKLKGKLVLPSSLTTIGGGAFSGCGFSGTLTIPEGVTSIGDYAFSSCFSFSGLSLPSTLTTISSYAFYSCFGFQGTLTLPEGVVSVGENAFALCTAFTQLNLPSTLTTIEYGAFSSCKFQGDLIFPSGLTIIGNYAFYKCSKLSGDLILPEGLSIIGGSAFEGCSGFTGELSLPSTLDTIGSGAFRSCCNFYCDLVLPEGLTSVGSEAFAYCTGFTGLSLPSSLKVIGYTAFRGCSGFTGTLELPEELTRIEHSAFYGCSGFNGNLILPLSLTYLGEHAFCSCSGLSTITEYSEVPPTIGDNVFLDTNNCPIYVPIGKVEIYKTANGWSAYASRIQSFQGGDVPGSGDGGDI